MKVLFAGTPAFAARHLSGLLASGVNIVGIITQPDRAGKRGKKPVPSDVKLVALDKNLALVQPSRLSLDEIKKFNADLLIVVAYGQILKTDVLSAPALGCINVHASLLPRWRGAAPIQRAIMAGDRETGICIMQMNEGLDTGKILNRKVVPITSTDTSLSLADKLVPLGIEALLETITGLASGTVIPNSQLTDGTCYASKITKAEAACRWQRPAEQIERNIRAFNPDPICYTFLGEMRVKLHQASILESHNPHGLPGEILSVTKKGVTVQCGEGVLLLQRLQLPIGKGSILTGADIINARSDFIHPGAVFCNGQKR